MFSNHKDPLLGFKELINNTSQERLHLDEVSFQISSYLGSDIVPVQGCIILDNLAKQFSGNTLADLSRFIFLNLGFKANKENDYDYQNYLLDHLLRSKVGISLTLGIVILEIGRRINLNLAGVTMPGRFLVKQLQGPSFILDPLEAKFLSLEQCRNLFYTSQGPNAKFHTSYLDPVGAHKIISQILAGLRNSLLASKNIYLLDKVLNLMFLVPNNDSNYNQFVSDLHQLANLEISSGLFTQAASHLDQVVELAIPSVADKARVKALQLRAKLN